MKRFADARVAAVFKAYPPPSRPGCWRCASWCSTSPPRRAGVGRLTETLKWGQPSYLTAESGSGTTVRIDRLKNRDDGYAIYFHCQSGLVEAVPRRSTPTRSPTRASVPSCSSEGSPAGARARPLHRARPHPSSTEEDWEQRRHDRQAEGQGGDRGRRGLERPGLGQRQVHGASPSRARAPGCSASTASAPPPRRRSA